MGFDLMYAYATTTITIYRGTDAADRYRDSEPSDSAIYSGIPASIINQTKTVVTQDTNEPNIVTFTTGRVGSGTDIKYGDRIMDEQSGVIYLILNARENQNSMMSPDIVLGLRRTSNYGA
jgi:hypothetical protein